MNIIKIWLRRLLHSFDKEIVTRPRILSLNAGDMLDLDLEMVLSHYYLKRPKMTVVQVGANDGTSADDPLFEFLARSKVSALVVEPQPMAFKKLCHNYDDLKNVTPINAAVAPLDGEMTFYSVRPDFVGPEWISRIASLDREVLLSHRKYVPGIESAIIETRVKCLSPVSLLSSGNLSSVNVLVVDVEGYDAKVVNAFLKLQEMPDVIYFEHCHLPKAEYSNCLNELLKNGYKVAQVKYSNTLAYRPNAT